ncbi:hypothetical protein OE88DRAFT_1662445 [Heliocybe sulcata]|uniref:Uncharacterized protein n=1 Tax=Heliocybe sulcata TaxID=5364 RepID=A0A5C3MXX9_9AGAM|nr:hypothetical protein OE88DRAFT_1662445 [Heliocybe sulcata]
MISAERKPVSQTHATILPMLRQANRTRLSRRSLQTTKLARWVIVTMLRSRMRCTASAQDGRVYLGRFSIMLIPLAKSAGRVMEWTGLKHGDIVKVIPD